MSNDDRQHQMDFILKQQAAFSADIEQLKEVQRQQAENINQLTKNVEAMREEMHESFTHLIHANEAMREEMQEGFNKLILANEITRKLTEDVARLTVGLSQRVTTLEQE